MRRLFYFNALVLVASLVFLGLGPASADGGRDGDAACKTTEVGAAKRAVPSPGEGAGSIGGLLCWATAAVS